ncbi:hypothetical protein PG996_004818 [Apiospora saccharicola]|uniref:Ankyrin repeat domain-containing protein n=1 Tax=Apiospora saccharicola TaxID=335842 RepID=A0ABR1W901_9PEZI
MRNWDFGYWTGGTSMMLSGENAWAWLSLLAVNMEDYNRTSPLIKALDNGDEATARILLEDAGVDPEWPASRDEVPNQAPVALAVWKGSAALTHWLLDHGADTDAGNPPAFVIAVHTLLAIGQPHPLPRG